MGGFFGVVSQNNCCADVFFGTDYHSHMGSRRGGMAFLAGNGFHRSIHDISNAQFRARFEHDIVKFSALDPHYGIGVISDNDDQPVLVRSHLGTYAIMIVGLVTNLEELAEELMHSRHAHFCEIGREGLNTVEVVSMLINARQSFVEGIEHLRDKIEGSLSLLILTEKGELYAARDRFGRTPIVLGYKPEDQAYAVAMESAAFPNLGYEHIRDIGPNEIIRITQDNDVESLLEPRKKMAICSFLYVYYGYPASSYEGRSVEELRYQSGRYLARRYPVDADYVGGIPDSGVAHALGLATESGITYARPFVKYTPTWARSFMPTEQAIRQQIAQMKLIPVLDLVKDKRLIFCDDSIVRGTQLKDQVHRLYDFGAKEIHMRIACPPLLYKCKFLTFSRTKTVMDLVTRRLIFEMDGEHADIESYRDPEGAPYKRLVEKLRDRLGMTSLQFQRLQDLKDAIGIGENICTYCWSGEDISLKGNGNCSGNCCACGDSCAMSDCLKNLTQK